MIDDRVKPGQLRMELPGRLLVVVTINFEDRSFTWGYRLLTRKEWRAMHALPKPIALSTPACGCLAASLSAPTEKEGSQ